MLALSSFNPSIDRYDWKSAAKLFKRLWTDPEIARAYASVLAASIQAAHRAGHACWEVTMFADCVRLNVGPVEVLELWGRGAKFEFKVPMVLPHGHDFKIRIPGGGRPVLRAVPIPSGVCAVPLLSLLSLPPALRQAHNAYIRAAASRRAVSPWKDVSTGIKGSRNHQSEGSQVLRASSAGTR
jgi:5-methylcytosine-specific restriction protein A